MWLNSSLLLALITLLSACGQKDGYSPTYSKSANKRYKIFVTSRADLAGSLVGTAGADLYCNIDAQAENGTYKALLGVGTRYPPSTDWPLKASADYYRIDGTTLIGTTTAGAIFSGTLVNSVSDNSVSVWTGMTSAFVHNDECTGFTATAGTGHTGLSDQKSVANMISNSTANCTTQMSLYCVEQ